MKLHKGIQKEHPSLVLSIMLCLTLFHPNGKQKLTGYKADKTLIIIHESHFIFGAH